MKKILFMMLMACAFLFTGCAYWFEFLSATVTVINESDGTLYFTAYYNGRSEDDKIRTINPNSEVTFETVKGWNTKSEIKKNGDEFKFYYAREAAWELIKKDDWYEEDDMEHNVWGFTDNWVKAGYVTRLVLEGKQSQSYTVKITDTNVYIYSNEE